MPQDDIQVKAFTLIELLVVISVIVLLMASLLPALARARKQAQAVVCQGKLRQLDLILSMYCDENEGRMPLNDPIEVWRLMVKTKLGTYPDLALCPAASKPLPGPLAVTGDMFHAASFLLGRADLRSSYGFNSWLFRHPVHVDGRVVPGKVNGKLVTWDTSYVKHAGSIPVVFDCTGAGVAPWHWEAPPEYEGAEATHACPLMRCICINRHHGGINMAFLDGSVRKVGLKEHWTLKWCRQFDTAGVWTKAGGALPEDWPEWMRAFKDY